MKKKGFTLVEVILTIALIGIIAAGFITLFPNYMKWMIRTKEKTTGEAFIMQKDIERDIDKIKKTLANNEEPDSDSYDSVKEDIFLFSEKFPKSGDFDKRDNTKVYIISNSSDSGKSVLSWVGETRLPPLPVPLLETPTLRFVSGSTSYEIEDKFEYFNHSELKMLAKSSLLENPKNSFYRNKHEWFVSDPGFLIPRPILADIDIDIDLGSIYPIFPNDYEPIPIYTPELNLSYSSTIPNNIINKYKGRHIIYTITPYSKDLKKGIMKTSPPLYLLGVPYSDKLKAHLDASTFDLKDDSLIVEDTNIGYIVKKWKNISPSPITANSYYATAPVEDGRPVLTGDIAYGDPNYRGPVVSFQNIEGEPKIWGRVLGNKDNNISTMSINDIDLKDNMSIFMIMRITDSPLAPGIGPIISGMGDHPWTIGWADDSGILKFGFINESNSLVSEVGTSLNLEKWYLIRVSTKEEEREISVIDLSHSEMAIDPILIPYANTEEIEIDKIDINWNGIELSEILIYEGDITSIESEIENHLINKYNP